MRAFISLHRIALAVSVFLFLLPFFWLAPGQMDLGGDSVRLYFYDPFSFLKASSIYHIMAHGKGVVEPNFYYIPYVAFLALLRAFFSGTTVIGFINGLKLGVGFLAVYLIVYEMLDTAKRKRGSLRTAASLLAGAWYVASFGSYYMSYFWNRAYTSHNQVFLNPLLFYLLLKFLLTRTFSFLYIALIISFVFASNFGLTSAPPLFAFYPLAAIFLLFYVYIFSTKGIAWRHVIYGVLLFFGVQAFQLLPQVMSMFDPGSFGNQRVFGNAAGEGINHFTALGAYGKATLNVLLPSSSVPVRWASWVGPVVLLTGFLVNAPIRKKYLFVSLFFFFVFFLVTANVTNGGFQLYRQLFRIPGFSMFRHFYTQWLYLYIFLYSILVGFGVFCIARVLRPYYRAVFLILISGFLVVSGFHLFAGQAMRVPLNGSANISAYFRMDPVYEQALQFVRTLPDDGKILVLPITDHFYQVFGGKDGGGYEGPSSIAHLLGKYTFVGYQQFGFQPGDPQAYAETIMRYTREKQYDKLLRIFAVLNIRYIFYNSDEAMFEKGFPYVAGPYLYMSNAMPTTQKAYAEFIRQLPFRQIFASGPYKVFEIDSSWYNPTIFVPHDLYVSPVLRYDAGSVHDVFIDPDTCAVLALRLICERKYIAPDVHINFRMKNLTLYEGTVQSEKPLDQLLLVLQHTYHTGWKLKINGTAIAEAAHFRANGYANGWLISGDHMPPSKTFSFVLELEPQKYLWYAGAITVGSLLIIVASLFRVHTRIWKRKL